LIFSQLSHNAIDADYLSIYRVQSPRFSVDIINSNPGTSTQEYRVFTKYRGRYYRTAESISHRQCTTNCYMFAAGARRMNDISIFSLFFFEVYQNMFI